MAIENNLGVGLDIQLNMELVANGSSFGKIYMYVTGIDESHLSICVKTNSVPSVLASIVRAYDNR